MNQVNTQGIVLSRTDYGEADRIITFLTPAHGKVRAYARSVRKSKSKLAGGIELFSVSDITFIKGRGEVNTLISTRLIIHWGNIVKDIRRTNAGYEFIKMLDKATEDEPEEEYFQLLSTAFEALDDRSIDLELLKLWFSAQLLRLSGHSPDLHLDTGGEKLEAGRKYDFDYGAMQFAQSGQGNFTPNHIKFLRLIFANNSPKALQKVRGYESLAPSCLLLLGSLNSIH